MTPSPDQRIGAVTTLSRPAGRPALLIAVAVAAVALPGRLPAQAPDPSGPAAVLLPPTAVPPPAPPGLPGLTPAGGPAAALGGPAKAVWRGVAGGSSPAPPEMPSAPQAPNPTGPMVWVVRPTGQVEPAPGYGVPPVSAPTGRASGPFGGAVRNALTSRSVSRSAPSPAETASSQTGGSPVPAGAEPVDTGTVSRTENGRTWRWYGYGATSPTAPANPPSPAAAVPAAAADLLQSSTPSNPPMPELTAQTGTTLPPALPVAPPGPAVAPGPTVATVPPTRLPPTGAPLGGPAVVPPTPPAAMPGTQWRRYPAPGAAEANNTSASAQTPVRLPAGRPTARAQQSPTDGYTRLPPTGQPYPMPPGTAPGMGVAPGWPQQPIAQTAATDPAGVAVTARKVAADPLHETVLWVCEGWARDVTVARRTDGSLVIHGKVRSSTHAEPLANRLAALPELGPYKVDFEFQVVP
jgi:hypothetical protein